MRLNKRLVGLLAATCAFLLALALVGFSQGGPGGPGRRGPGGPGGPGPCGPGGPGGPFGEERGPRGVLGPFGRDLNLTDEQKAQIKQLTDSFESNTRALHEQLRALHESQPDILNSGFDEAAVRAQAQKRASIEIELDVAHARLMSQVFAALTPEQKARLNERRQQFEQKRKEWEAQRGNTTSEQQ